MCDIDFLVFKLTRYIFGVRSGIEMAQMEIPLPEIATEDFTRAWTRFGLVYSSCQRVG